jgi:D-sedoheptulose 7-phosphate isomerase|tara:strand:- start:2579 stop:3181 length:603 start_codon:yes stop_codon:yes gene_type:complete
MTRLEYRKLLQQTLNDIDLDSVGLMTEIFLQARENGSRIYTMGNGGSAANASHAAGDFLKGASFGLEKRFNIICLNDNIPSLMAIANDVGWDDIFIEPLKNFLKKDDIVIGISGSGNSKNILKAIDFSKKIGAKTIGMTGFDGGELKKVCDLSIHSPAMDMEIAEDIHMAVFNMVKKEVMSVLMPKNASMGETYDNRIMK